jgi:hypothetical protein
MVEMALPIKHYTQFGPVRIIPHPNKNPSEGPQEGLEKSIMA